MNKYDFARAKAIIYGPGAAARTAALGHFKELGFQDVEVSDDLVALERMLQQGSPDLLLCDVDHADAQVAEIIQSLRHGWATPNPFLSVICTAATLGHDITALFRDAGVDALMSRPASAAGLGEQIRLLIEERKKFVVTSDYVGPDRRRDPSRRGVECFEAPNSLWLKVLNLPSEEMERQIAQSVAAGIVMLHSERLRRAAFQLCVQWRLLVQRRPGAPEFAACLRGIGSILEDLERRAGVEYVEDTRNYSRQAREAIIRIEQATRETLKSAIGELGEVCLSLGQLFAFADLTPSNMVEFDNLVARIDVRQTVPAVIQVPFESSDAIPLSRTA